MSVQLARVTGVELARTGQWSASTGVSTITREDLAHAVEALECPAVRDPIIKLGHVDPRFDGQPAVGRITNLEVVDEYSLRGDLDGLPDWLGQIMASAFPSRSIEATWNYECSVGHTHDFVLTGLALLGVQEPAIGSLSTLEDIAALYGINEYESQEIAAGKGVTMSTSTIAASATVEDIRRTYYDTAGWDLWIEEIQLAPLQLIVVRDSDGVRLRIPVTVDPDKDGSDALLFGDAVPVVVRYDDVVAPAVSADPAAPVPVAASNLRFASRADSQRISAGQHEGDTMARTIAAAADTGSGDANPGGLSTDQLTTLRELLGLTEAADPAILGAALEALVAKFNPAEAETPEQETAEEDAAAAEDTAADDTADEDPKKKVAASGAPATVTVDAAAFAAMQADVGRFREFEKVQARQRADQMVDAAFAAGKIGRGAVDGWKAQAHKDIDGTKSLLDTLAASSAFPVGEVGHSVLSADTTNVRDDAAYKNWSI